MQLYQDGEKKRANLNLLIQYARQYEAQGQAAFTGGVTGFLRYIDALLEHDRDLEQANPSNGADCAVFLKTMHRSKGLEFPFVFLAELETEFSKQDSSKKMHVSDTGRMGLYLYDAKNYQKYQTLSYLVLLKEKKQQLLQEEMRLLYVAMTRAKQKLFLPLQLGEKRKDDCPSVAKQGFLQGICLPCSGFLRQLYGILDLVCFVLPTGCRVFEVYA